ASKDSRFPEGSYVANMLGWREAFTTKGDNLRALDPAGISLPVYLGTLGMPGMTAWVGLFRIAQLRDGGTMFVSGGAGAVGSTVCGLARMHHCRVIASAGTEEKVRFLREEIKVDYAFNYRDGDPLEHLQKAAPQGLDVYFDNTMGPQLEAAINAMQNFGRIAA